MKAYRNIRPYRGWNSRLMLYLGGYIDFQSIHDNVSIM